MPSAHQHYGHEMGSEASVRPRIELHPEEHAYRPARTQNLDWRIDSDYRRPDGVLKKVYLINGERDHPEHSWTHYLIEFMGD